MPNRLVTLLAAVLIPLASAAQDVAGPRNVISIQPINAIVLTAYSAEYERQLASAVSFGVGGTYWNPNELNDELTYKSADLKLRYYPQGTALQGFAFGGSVGFSSISATNTFDGTEDSASGPSFGVLLEYQWLMGAKRNFAVALGVGAKAVMVSEEDISTNNFTARYPTARISVGYAF